MACYFVYPKKGSEKNLIGVIAGTGEEGMRLTYLRPFLKPGASFADVTVFNSEILENKDKGLSAAEFLGWIGQLKTGNLFLSNNSGKNLLFLNIRMLMDHIDLNHFILKKISL